MGQRQRDTPTPQSLVQRQLPDVAVQTTVCHPGEAIFLDTTKFGRAVVREPLSMRLGWANDDFTRNILRTISETRLNLAVERPSAVLWMTELPLSVLETGTITKTTAGKK